MSQKYILYSNAFTIKQHFFNCLFYFKTQKNTLTTLLCIKNKNPTEVGLYIAVNTIYFIIFFKTRIVTEAKIAPVTFAKTSNTSALLVVVNNPCIISIAIP